MPNKIHWLSTGLLVAALAAVGCGGGSSGPGSAPAPAVLTLYNSSVDFGDVAVGSSSTLGVTLANTGGSLLTLQQNSVSGLGFATSGIGSGVTLLPGQYVTLAVSFDPSGTGKLTGAVSLTSTASNAPVNLTLSGNGVVVSHWATFNWSASKSPAVGYNVYLRSTSGDSWVRLNSSPVISTSFTDWDVQAGQSYLYAVTAVSPQNGESAFSNATQATIPSP